MSVESTDTILVLVHGEDESPGTGCGPTRQGDLLYPGPDLRKTQQCRPPTRSRSRPPSESTTSCRRPVPSGAVSLRRWAFRCQTPEGSLWDGTCGWRSVSRTDGVPSPLGTARHLVLSPESGRRGGTCIIHTPFVGGPSEVSSDRLPRQVGIPSTVFPFPTDDRGLGPSCTNTESKGRTFHSAT